MDSKGPTTRKPPFYIPSLDGIRAVAISIVFIAHANLIGDWIPGAFGVTVFFFLSGYLITTLIRREYDKFGSFSFKLFYMRRILRIWPAFYLVLIVSTLLTLAHVLPGKIELFSFLAQFFHLANLVLILDLDQTIAVGTAVYWSLAVEEHFYLIFPWFYIFLIQRGLTPKQQALVMWVICGLILLWRCILVFGLHAEHNRTYLATDTRMDSMLFGCILAVSGNPILDRPDRPVSATWKTVSLSISAALLLVSFLYRDEAFRETLRYSLQGIAFLAIFTVAIREPDYGVFRWLNLSWVKFIGSLSYSLYIVHATVIGAIHSWLPSLGFRPQALIALVICGVIAYLMYVLIEQPIGKLRHRLVQKPEASPLL
jgi:peptidoglycan/LPS O-acetylase OafA/YrhL